MAMADRNDELENASGGTTYYVTDDSRTEDNNTSTREDSEDEKNKINKLTGMIHSRFTEDDIVGNQNQIITDGIWSNSEGSLSTFYTSSEQTDYQKKYYYEIHQSASADFNSEPQFSIAYGNYIGGGTLLSNEDYPTKAIYNQYRMLLAEDNDRIIVDGTEQQGIYVINVNRSRYKDRLDEGNIQLALANLDGNTDGESIAVSGTSITTLIDDSSTTDVAKMSDKAGRVFNLVSGSINEGVYSGSSHVYGKFYPDLGIVLLRGDSMDTYFNFNTQTSTDIKGANNNRLFTSISGAAVINETEGSFYARNKENLTANHYFCRVKNGEFNYSNNPSFVDSDGRLRYPNFIKDPKTYVTTIGLYNDGNELLAVAKLSQPIIKSFYNELLVKVKLEF